MLRILWNSDKILGTSAYSKVTYQVCTRLAKIGYPIAHLPMGMANKMGNWVYQNVLIYESGDNPFNEDIVFDKYIDFKADLLITLKDPWVFTQTQKYAMNFVPHAIIDHEPVNHLLLSSLENSFRIICVSRFAQRELRNNGITDTTYIPHGVDTQIYMPLDSKKCKKLWYLPEDDFTVLFIGRNQSRKMIPIVLKAYKLFKERNPDIKSHLILWTDINPTSKVSYDSVRSLGVADVGVNLIPEIVNLNLGDDIIFPDPKTIREGLPEQSDGHDLVKLYNAADVVISLSGEGFWLVGLEAESCGKPVICANFAASPEICGVGYTVPVKDYVILNTPGSRYPICDVDKAAEYIAKIANGDKEKMAIKARKFAERYDWNIIINKYMIPFLQDCELELKPLVTKEGVFPW